MCIITESDNSEQRMWREYKETRDPEIKEYFVKKYYPLVRYIANRVSRNLPSHIEYEDLVGYGTFGLLDAIEKYNSDINTGFRTYATFRIKGAMFDELSKTSYSSRSVPEISLCKIISSDENIRLSDTIECHPNLNPEIMFEKKERETLITNTLKILSDKEKKVISLYYFEGLTIKEIGEVFYVSQSRASQIHKVSLNKLKQRLKNKKQEEMYA